MDDIKTGNVYDFTKQLQQKTRAEFIKIIKITKNWKVIGYFKNQKAMEEAVEDSCTLGDMGKIWLVRNQKTIYKAEKQEKKTTGKKQENEKEKEERILPSTSNEEEPKTPTTPQVRIYQELSNFAFQKQTNFNLPPLPIPLVYFGNKGETKKPETPKEDEVVNLINKWRLTDDTESDQGDDNLEESKILKQDNLAPEEVVEVIKEYRSDSEKWKYTRLSTSPNITGRKVKNQAPIRHQSGS
jgi:hypothetical protein